MVASSAHGPRASARTHAAPRVSCLPVGRCPRVGITVDPTSPAAIARGSSRGAAGAPRRAPARARVHPRVLALCKLPAACHAVCTRGSEKIHSPPPSAAETGGPRSRSRGRALHRVHAQLPAPSASIHIGTVRTCGKDWKGARAVAQISRLLALGSANQHGLQQLQRPYESQRLHARCQ